jgi:hypothetical protein
LPLLELDLARLGVFSPSGLSVALTFSLKRAERLGVSPAYKLFRGSNKTLNIGKPTSTKTDEFTIQLRSGQEIMELDAYWFPNQTLKMQGLQDELSGTESAVSCF